MEYIKRTLASTRNYKVTYYSKGTPFSSNKCIITFGEIDSNMEDLGFGSKLIMSNGYDYIYVAQRKQTQYQFLEAETFANIVGEVIKGKDVYTYGSSLGAYCAIYYGGIINANILAMSPRIPAHPAINALMRSRFKNKGFKHNELHEVKQTNNRVAIFYDENNYIDRHYVDIYIKPVYPNASYHHIDYAGHYTARALLLSGQLKKVATDFFNNNNLEYELNKNAILDWHIDKAEKRINNGKLLHAQENIDVLLSSKKSQDENVQNLVSQFKEKQIQKYKKKKTKRPDKIYPIISKDEKEQIENAVSLSFVGDLILLRDQVLNAYNPQSDSYEFDNMFEYVTKYLQETNFSMGVFEGPTAGEKYEYSTSVYGDGIPIYLNFPDSFAHSVKRAGFDFVTTAQSHFLDCGIEGAMRTLDILDQANLKHSGTYRNKEEKEKLPIYNVDGLKVAILAYTRHSNRYKSSFFLKKENEHLTRLLVSPKDENFELIKKNVFDDFEKIKKENPDCIVVLPHMGQQQFRHQPDIYQKTWCDIFVKAGADVILSDHPHTVQPYEWRKKPNTKTDVLILHCPGNFVNSYIKKNEDASALSQVYLNPDTGKPFAVGCVPLWAHSYLDQNYKALPIYDIIHNNELRKNISTYEFERIKKVNELITNTMLGEKLTIDQVQEKYYLFADRADNKSKGYVRNHVQPITIPGKLKNKSIVKLLSKSKSVCFVGDSVTEGTRNGGYGWFEPLAESFSHLELNRFTKGNIATPFLVERADEIADFKSDLFVIAVGTNDVRYRNPKHCAMTSTQYIDNLDYIVQKVISKNKSAKFVFIAPWTTDSHDPISKLPKEERFNLLEEYSSALKKYAKSKGFVYIDPNPFISAKFKTRNPKTWIKDHIHPNANEGIHLYSDAVLQSSPESRFSLENIINKIKF
uniref:CapA family protein n=1 Tax=uncultured Allobacillus sp. TaxID=1638025 RepID=UPI002598A96D|nr:CapA family protein [uncultured Allobacillus sp.]